MREMEKLKEQVEEKMKNIAEQGVQGNNLEVLGKLVDVYKDLKEVEHWQKKDEGGSYMNYRGEYDRNPYGNDDYREGGYSRRGNFREGEYGARRARDSRGRYKGEEMIDQVYDEYRNYSQGREEYSRGNYGAQSSTMKSLEYMLESVVEFIKMLEKEASSQEEVNLIKKYTKKISEM